MLSWVGPKPVTPPPTRDPSRWGRAVTMEMASGCALPGDGISSPSCWVCICVFGCVCVCVCVCVPAATLVSYPFAILPSLLYLCE